MAAPRPHSLEIVIIRRHTPVKCCLHWAVCYPVVLGFLTGSVCSASFDSTVSQEFPQNEIRQKNSMRELLHTQDASKMEVHALSSGISTWHCFLTR